VPLRIVLSGSGTPGEQISAQLRGFIASGLLASGERLPSVRQLANDLGIAPGTVAKVYRALDTEGLLSTRIGSGTRVSPHAGRVPQQVLESARRLAETAVEAGLAPEEAARVLSAVWPTPEGAEG